VKIPVIYVAAETVRPNYTRQQLAAAGFAMSLYPLSLIQTTFKAQQDMLRSMFASGDTVQLVDGMAQFADVGRLVGVERAAAFDAELATQVNEGS
jgi:methylisocitrate lyase